MEGGMQAEMNVLDAAMDRRRFTLASAMAILSGVVVTITDSACGGSSYSPSSPSPSPSPSPTPNPNPSPSGDKVGVISNNHGHSAVITAARLGEAGDLSLDIQGSASHTHRVDLSAADLAAVAANQRVSKESTTDSGHSHTVTFN
jgi:hypothetical protein